MTNKTLSHFIGRAPADRLRKEPANIVAAAHRALAIARPLLDAQGHELTVAVPSHPLWVDGDPVRLAQIIGILLNNAAKHTEPGGHVWLTVSQDRVGPDSSTLPNVVISVRDNGIGIEPDRLSQVFQPFDRPDRSSERPQDGLGIGLTLVRNLVEMHDGKVAAHSEGPGRGSEFTVRLPQIASIGRQGDGARAPAPSDGRRILVVDDNEGATLMQAMLLRKLANHDVRVAHDGPAALALAAEFDPEIVLLDIGLPGMSGHDVARRLRSDSRQDGALLVALTGHDGDEDRRLSQEAGFDIHLVKPSSLDALRQIFLHPRLRRAAAD